MQFFVLRRIVVHFRSLAVFDAALSSDDDLGACFLLQLFLCISTGAKNQSDEGVIWILFLRNEELGCLLLFGKGECWS